MIKRIKIYKVRPGDFYYICGKWQKIYAVNSFDNYTELDFGTEYYIHLNNESVVRIQREEVVKFVIKRIKANKIKVNDRVYILGCWRYVTKVTKCRNIVNLVFALSSMSVSLSIFNTVRIQRREIK